MHCLTSPLLAAIGDSDPLCERSRMRSKVFGEPVCTHVVARETVKRTAALGEVLHNSNGARSQSAKPRLSTNKIYKLDKIVIIWVGLSFGIVQTWYWSLEVGHNKYVGLFDLPWLREQCVWSFLQPLGWSIAIRQPLHFLLASIIRHCLKNMRSLLNEYLCRWFHLQGQKMW